MLDAAANHPELDEVIVVNDGSSDGTAQIVKSYPVTLVDMPKNGGKSFAVKNGIEKARNDVILLLDADLRGLTSQNISDLLRPVLQGKADVALSCRKTFPLAGYLAKEDFLTGERVFQRDLMDLRTLGTMRSFGIEAYMNDMIIRRNLQVAVVPWYNVHNTLKMEKQGFITGLLGDMRMLWHESSTVGHGRFIEQMIRMRDQVVR